jgi:hypothetical protein
MELDFFLLLKKKFQLSLSPSPGLNSGTCTYKHPVLKESDSKPQGGAVALVTELSRPTPYPQPS